MYEDDMDKLVEELKRKGVNIGKTAFRYKKMGITKYLADNPDCNAVILSEYLEEKSPYCEQDFEYLADMYEEVTLIPILKNNCDGDGLAASLYSLGIFTGIYDADANFENMASILMNGRTRKEAKAYYEIRGQSASHHSIDYRSTVSYLQNARGEELEEMVGHVLGIVNDAELSILLKMLDRETYEAIRKLGRRDLMPYFMTANESKPEGDEPLKPAKKIIEKYFGRKRLKAGIILLFFLLFGLGAAKCIMREHGAGNREKMHTEVSKAVEIKLRTSYPKIATAPSASPRGKKPVNLEKKQQQETKEKGICKRKNTVRAKHPPYENKDSKAKRRADRPVISYKPQRSKINSRKSAKRKASKKKSSEKIKRSDEYIIGIN